MDSGRFYPLLGGTGREDVRSCVGLDVPNIFREDGLLVCLHHHQGVFALLDDGLDVIMLRRGASIEVRHAENILSVEMLPNRVFWRSFLTKDMLAKPPPLA